MVEKSSTVSKHVLSDKWVLWAHLPHDTDWSLKSYIKIIDIHTLEDMVMIQSAIPEKMIKNCMLFMMKKGVNPTWEDPKNIDGGCFSFKVSNKNVFAGWNNLLLTLVSNQICKNDKFINKINGVTISPKKTFCIVKIWMETVQFQNTELLQNVDYLNVHGCLFKRHNHKG